MIWPSCYLPCHFIPNQLICSLHSSDTEFILQFKHVLSSKPLHLLFPQLQDWFPSVIHIFIAFKPPLNCLQKSLPSNAHNRKLPGPAFWSSRHSFLLDRAPCLFIFPFRKQALWRQKLCIPLSKPIPGTSKFAINCTTFGDGEEKTWLEEKYYRGINLAVPI